MDDPLALDPATMRATGYRMVDLLVEQVAGVRDRPALTRASPAEMRARMRPDLLAGAMAVDVAAGRRPLFVAASAGSTNTGAID
jgi:hypothetical protein